MLVISTFEQSGGAARTAHRLYQQLNKMGVDCRMLVQYKQSDDSLVSAPRGWIAQITRMLRPYLDALPLYCYRSRLSPPWSLAWLPIDIRHEVASFAPDLIHIHGVGHGFLSLDSISLLPGPLVWTLHDSWAFTGGCHLPGDCERYSDRCGYCPQLNMRHENDLSRWGWNRKAEMWPQLDLTFVAPSHWLARCAASSSLLSSKKIEVIPNGVDTSYFTPRNSSSAKATLGLPNDEIVILYGASAFLKDANKGFYLLQEAMKQVVARKPQKKLVLALFGDSTYGELEFHGIPARSYGHVSTEDQLVTLYSAADIFILPSLQENLPNTVMEAMACGTPCVAFEVGGVGDLISHGENGYLAKAANEHDLAEGITWMLADDDRRARLGRQARKTIEDGFSLAEVAERHFALYSRVIDDSRKTGAKVL